MRLRRFLMTEPMRPTFFGAYGEPGFRTEPGKRDGPVYRTSAGVAPGRPKAPFCASGRPVHQVLQRILDRRLGDAERAAEADGGQVAGVDEAVDRHPGDAHHFGAPGDGEEAGVSEGHRRLLAVR